VYCIIPFQAETFQLLVLHSSFSSKLMDNFEGLLVHFSEVSECLSLTHPAQNCCVWCLQWERLSWSCGLSNASWIRQCWVWSSKIFSAFVDSGDQATEVWEPPRVWEGLGTSLGRPGAHTGSVAVTLHYFHTCITNGLVSMELFTTRLMSLWHHTMLARWLGPNGVNKSTFIWYMISLLSVCMWHVMEVDMIRLLVLVVGWIQFSLTLSWSTCRMHSKPGSWWAYLASVLDITTCYVRSKYTWKFLTSQCKLLSTCIPGWPSYVEMLPSYAKSMM